MLYTSSLPVKNDKRAWLFPTPNFKKMFLFSYTGDCTPTQSHDSGWGQQPQREFRLPWGAAPRGAYGWGPRPQMMASPPTGLCLPNGVTAPVGVIGPNGAAPLNGA